MLSFPVLAAPYGFGAMNRLGFALLVAWLGVACARPGHLGSEQASDSQRTIQGVTYTASLATPTSESFRTVVRVQNDSRLIVEVRPSISCDVHIQLRPIERPVAEAAIWDSERSRRGWECVGVGGRSITVGSGQSRELFTDFPLFDVNESVPRGSYEVFALVGGPTSPGWLHAGRMKIPVP